MRLSMVTQEWVYQRVIFKVIRYIKLSVLLKVDSKIIIILKVVI